MHVNINIPGVTDETASDNRGLVLRMLDQRGAYGATWSEVGEAFGWHHGTSSGILSNMHKDGLIARLSEKRGGAKVYVIPRSIANRPTEKHKSVIPAQCPSCGVHL